MFDDQQANSAGQSNNLDDGSNNNLPPTPSLSMGMNPNPAPGSSAPSSNPVTPAVVIPTPQMHDSPTAGTVNSKLEDIKRQALEHLSPLVSQLDQTPEEKYKTLMMMIQASDNQDLLSEAYDAAQKITDEKARAEALLNIVNEINYFSQKTA